MRKLFSLLVCLLLAVRFCSADPHLEQRPRYTLRAGDVVEMALRYTPEYNQTLTVQPDGYINVNLAGEIQVVGLTISQTHDAIEKLLSERLNHPEINLTLKQFERPYVTIGGEVQAPGKIEFQPNMTAMQAVLLAGGFRASARETRIVVFRHLDKDIGEVRTIDLHKIRKTKDLERNMALEPGDMILVPANRLESFSRYMQASHFSAAVSPALAP